MSEFGLNNLAFVVMLLVAAYIVTVHVRGPFSQGSGVGPVSILWVLIIVGANATRAVGYPSDMALYIGGFRRAGSSESLAQFIAQEDGDKGFVAFQWLLARLDTDPRFFVGMAALLTCVVFWLAIRLLLPSAPAAVVFFMATIFPFTAYYLANTVRQGIAASLLMLALAVFSRPQARRSFGITLLVLAVAVHLSALMPAFAVAYNSVRRPSVRASTSIWFLGVLLYITSLNSRLLSWIGIDDPRFVHYAGREAVSAYEGGVNRLDFLAFSCILVIVISFMYRRLLNLEPSTETLRTATSLVSGFILLNTVFLLFGFLAFSDRIGAYSWLIAPIVLGYLILNPESGRSLGVRYGYIGASCLLTLGMQGWPDLLERTPISK